MPATGRGREETGLELAPAEVDSPLDAEHDAHRWLPLDAAGELCLPVNIADGLRAAAASLD